MAACLGMGTAALGCALACLFLTRGMDAPLSLAAALLLLTGAGALGTVRLSRSLRAARGMAWLLFWVNAACLAGILLCSRLWFGVANGVGGQVNLNPLAPFFYDRVDWGWVAGQVGANVLLFMPLGFLLPALFPRLRRGARLFCTAFLVTLAAEALQHLLRVGMFDVTDLAANLLGAVAGFWVWRVCGSRLWGRVRAWAGDTPFHRERKDG